MATGHTFETRVLDPKTATDQFPTGRVVKVDRHEASAGLDPCEECRGIGIHSGFCSHASGGHRFAYTQVIDGITVHKTGIVGEAGRRPACSVCQGVGAHSRDCRLASRGHTFTFATFDIRSNESVWRQGTVGTPPRKAFDEPPEDKMVERPTMKKGAA
jgi:hypothetical protein